MHLLECDLWCSTGQFDRALDCLSQYEHSSIKKISDRRERAKLKMKLQFDKARLLVSVGQFAKALSEYEDLLERMRTRLRNGSRRELLLTLLMLILSLPQPLLLLPTMMMTVTTTTMMAMMFCR